MARINEEMEYTKLDTKLEAKLDTKLDLKNRKILFELDKNSRISLSGLAKKIRLSKEVVFHRINNLVRERVILRFQTVISTYRLGYQSYKLYFKLQNLTPKIKLRIQNYFLKNNSVYWIGNCQGKWGLIIAFWAEDLQKVGNFEDEILNKFSSYIQERELTISRKNMQFNRRWFYYDEIEPVEMTFGEELKEEKIDRIDTEILRYLANNARIKLSELARLTKTSISVVRYRIKQLERKGIIIGYKYALNTHKLGYETCKAFISLKNVTNIKRKALIEYIKLKPNAINIVLTIGPWDMEIEFEVRNFEEYYQLMNDIQERFNKIIRNYDSVLFSSEPKQSFMPGAHPKMKRI